MSLPHSCFRLRLLLVLLLGAALMRAVLPARAQPAATGFVHPGILHTRASLDAIRHAIDRHDEPWTSGFARLRADPYSSADWKLRGPFARVVRGPNENVNNDALWQDGNAAYQNALMWCLTGDTAHAAKAAQILDAWSGALQSIEGHDAILAASIYGDKYVNAAELLRYTYPQWDVAHVSRCAGMLRNVFYPVMQHFATFANGNWDAGCVKTILGIAIFTDDRTMYDDAITYYRHGSGDGSLSHYILNAAGQCQESGRDQQHTQLGLGHLAEACEIAWNQGLDLYSEADNRLLAGFEYTARYNLGEEVAFTPHTDVTGKYHADRISMEGRGNLRPIYEMAWNHYHNRRGMDAPYTGRAAAKLRPEGAGFQADEPGFGTLLFTRPFAPNSRPLVAVQPEVDLSNPEPTDIYQWSLPMPEHAQAPEASERRAYLWIPRNCKRVRGLLVGLQNMKERDFFQDATIRRTCADCGLGIVWIAPGYAKDDSLTIGLPDAAAAAAELNGVLKRLASDSGYGEIAGAPLLFVGHSAASPFVWGMGKAMQDRTIALIPYKGYFLDAPNDVPILYVSSEWAEWTSNWGEVWRSSDLPNIERLRARPGGRCLIGSFVDAGAGHFDWNPAAASVIALFIRKAVAYRLPADASDGPVVLRSIDPASGVVVDADKLGTLAARVLPASDPTAKGCWYFDREMAEAVCDYDAAEFGKKPQMIDFTIDGTAAPLTQSGFVELRPDSTADDESVRVTATHLDRSPGAHLYAGEMLAIGPSAISFSVGSGAIVQKAPDTFGLQIGRGSIERQGPPWESWIIARAPATAEFRAADRPAHVPFPTRNTAGAPQTLDFPPIPHLRPVAGSNRQYQLSARASSSLPVQFWVVSGPAEMVGKDRLLLRDAPPRARRPLRVVVAAYQWGRATGEKIQSAGPVFREFDLP